ncbi:MAG: tRNA adenosine deaminase-associated protein [Actinomycetes bacterium]|jgi:putative tRNA adenosine deaminase-associated protein
MAADDIDYVVAIYREGGQWVAAPLPPRAGESLDNVVQAIRQFPGEGGNLGFVSIHDDAAVVLRVTGPDVHVFISDASAADDFSLAAEVIDLVGEPEDDEEPAVAGDTSLLKDFGISTSDLMAICEDNDFYPHDVFAEIAERLGCGPQFEHARDESGA